MSSLRRRAIVVSRARSAERSSIGGRVSARAAAAESSGSASTRSQAIASRTSGRWKSAAGPERWKGMPRSSIAAATGAAVGAGSSTSTQISSGGVPAGEQVLGLARDRLRLRSLVRAAPEAHRRVAEALLERRVPSRVWLPDCERAPQRRRAGGRLPRLPARRGGSGCPRRSAARIARWAGVVSSSSSTIRCSKRWAISARTSGRSCEELVEGRGRRRRGRGCRARRGCGRGRRQSSASSGSGGSEPAFSSSICASRRASRPAGLPRISWRRRGSSSRRSSSIASRSAGPRTSKKGSRPAAVECSRSSRSPSCSQVPIQSSS